ncbi:MAG: transglycosylase SLT domain-containing protein [Deltaproteobacteria bacterium]|nr:transglycosylase SLT domain-containing protein [Deltaproteobacteria bacterium]
MTDHALKSQELRRRQRLIQTVRLGLPVVLVVVAAFVVAAGVRDPQVLAPSARQRLAASESEGAFSLSALHMRLPPEAMRQVQRHIEYFQRVQPGRITDGLGRSSKYMDTFRKIFESKGLPGELAYLPLVESGFMETAVSPAQAAGIWQFIEDTGRRYNLQRTAWSDQRLDPIKSAEAAATLLQHLFLRFKNWELALAAYNSGQGTVDWAIKTNLREKKGTDFWSLDLPEETTAYVPTFIAAVVIAKNPEAFGFKNIRFQPKLSFDEIKVTPGTALDEVANELELSQETLWELNPTLILGTVPPGDKPYQIRVPTGVRKGVPGKISAVGPLKDWVLHRVAETDTVEVLASRFRSKSQSILEVNKLSGDADLSTRTFVLIPL